MSLEETITHIAQKVALETTEKRLDQFLEEYIPDEAMTAKAAAKQLGVSIVTFNKFVKIQMLIQPINHEGDPRYSRREIIKFNEKRKTLKQLLPRRK